MNLQHHFLIAMPTLEDPLFKRSVIYICEHTDEGAMGIIINKPMENLTVAGVLEKLEISNDSITQSSRALQQAVFNGGPMAEDRGFILHSGPLNFASTIAVSATTQITTSKDVLESFGTPDQPEQVLVALGYCAWEKQQLEDEILSNAWLTAPASEQILFHTPAGSCWKAAAKQLGIDIHTMTGESGHA